MKIFYLILISALSLTLASCEDYNMILPGEVITVSGTIGVDIGYIDNATVEINGNDVITNGKGEFSFNEVSTPYDLKIITENKKHALIYKGLSSGKLELNIAPGGIDFGSTSVAVYNLNVPLSDSVTRKILVGFIPDDPDLELAIFPNIFISNDIQLLIKPNYGTQFTGTLVLMYYTISGTEIVSYDRFYEKHNITLNMGGNPVNDTISILDPYIDPPETTISGFVNNYYGAPSNTRIKLGFKNNYSGYYDFIYNSNQNNNFSFTVPSGLPDYLKFTIGSSYIMNSVGNTFTFTKLLPGSGDNQIYLNPITSIVEPTEMTSVNLYGMRVSINDFEPGNGIYETIIYYENANNGNSIAIYSADPIVTVPDLSSLGFLKTPGQTYKIVSRKLYQFNNMNEFASSNYAHGNLYNAKATSIERSFIAQ
ncbi:MAG TPA: hypothetical protein VK004_06455 [Ignavibacteria bacterium]|nr:hypothetical protein [Ignavibacteria bacterium]